jgi:hypothetical protein
MKGSLVVAAALILLSGCQAITRMVHAEPDMTVQIDGAIGGEPGELHPAVIEFMFVSPQGPFLDYYRAALAADDPPVHLERLEEIAAALAGSGPPSERHYAAARARTLAIHINEGLVQGGITPGSVTLQCCATADPDSNRLHPGLVFARIVVNEPLSVVRMDWEDARTKVELTWDLRRVPGAFDPSAELHFEQVAASAAPLHRAVAGDSR